MLHSAQVNLMDCRGGEPTAEAQPCFERSAGAGLGESMGRRRALAALDQAMRALSAVPEQADLVRELDAAYRYFNDATAEWEIRAADMWNAALRAADVEIRAVALPRAGWSLDAQTSACTCALIVWGLAIGSARSRMTPEEQAQQVVLRG